MIDLTLVKSATSLSTNKTYQIDSVLYYYLHSDGTTAHPQYIFRPLRGQRKKVDLKLNSQKLLRHCYEVPGMPVKSEVTSEVAQMKLF
ncbi:MAG: hypothetical protein KME55_34800 [Nostoc indistinguendum CM1-VF10]|jgi:hypothetical protein|nr:hypothetical protein [Nostoc indistinguendum CM1-VF10]